MVWFDRNGNLILHSCRENINRIHRGQYVYGAVGIIGKWDMGEPPVLQTCLKPNVQLISDEMPDIDVAAININDSPIRRAQYLIKTEGAVKGRSIWVIRCALPPYRHTASYALLLMRLLCEHPRLTGGRATSLTRAINSSDNPPLGLLSMDAWRIYKEMKLEDEEIASLKGIIDWVAYQLQRRQNEHRDFLAQAVGYDDSYEEEEGV